MPQVADRTTEMFDKKLYYRRWWRKTGFQKPPTNRLATLAGYSRLIASMTKPSSLVLEVGCGQGHGLQMLKSQGCEYLVGIDLANVFQPSQNADFVVAEPTHLPFREGLLDIIFARKFVDIYDVRESLKEFSRTLKSDGTLVIEVPNIKRLKSRIYSSMGLSPKYDAPYFPRLHQTSFKNLLCKGGFAPSGIRGDYIDIPMIGTTLSHFNQGILLRKLGEIRPNLCLHLLAICSKKKKPDSKIWT